MGPVLSSASGSLLPPPSLRLLCSVPSSLPPHPHCLPWPPFPCSLTPVFLFLFPSISFPQQGRLAEAHPWGQAAAAVTCHLIRFHCHGGGEVQRSRVMPSHRAQPEFTRRLSCSGPCTLLRVQAPSGHLNASQKQGGLTRSLTPASLAASLPPHSQPRPCLTGCLTPTSLTASSLPHTQPHPCPCLTCCLTHAPASLAALPPPHSQPHPCLTCCLAPASLTASPLPLPHSLPHPCLAHNLAPACQASF